MSAQKEYELLFLDIEMKSTASGMNGIGMARRPVSRKEKDRSLHGIGLSNVKREVEKCMGDIDIKVNKNIKYFKEDKIMTVTGIGNSYNVNAAGIGGMGGEVSAIEKELQAKKQELSQLNKKQELSKDEQTKKRELEQQIAELEQRLQKAKSEERQEKISEKAGLNKVRAKEDGKGEKVDELI